MTLPNLSPSRKLAAGVVLVALALGAGWFALRRQDKESAEIRVPELSPVAQSGRLAFDRSCSACHGVHAAGSEKGPALVHRVYQPGLHADSAFELAVRRGVRAHHWSFGDMPPQPEVTATEVASITRYVRELQKANGIE